MSPAPRRGRAKPKEDAPAAATTSKRRGRASKAADADTSTNGEGDAEDATPTPGRAKFTPEQRLEMGERIAEMRDEGTPWLEIAEELGLSGGVPARQMMNEYLASTDPEFSLDPDADDFADTIVELRDEGTGWGELQARSGLSKSELIEVYTEAGGEMAEGRVYHNAKSGQVTHKTGSNRGESNGDAEDGDEEQEAPAPRRGRGRRSAAQEEAPATPARGRGRRARAQS
jgi:hypothetical protein